MLSVWRLSDVAGRESWALLSSTELTRCSLSLSLSRHSESHTWCHTTKTSFPPLPSPPCSDQPRNQHRIENRFRDFVCFNDQANIPSLRLSQHQGSHSLKRTGYKVITTPRNNIWPSTNQAWFQESQSESKTLRWQVAVTVTRVWLLYYQNIQFWILIFLYFAWRKSAVSGITQIVRAAGRTTDRVWSEDVINNESPVQISHN